MSDLRWKSCAAAVTMIFSPLAHSATVADDFQQAVNTNNWKALGYSCLTAGTAANNTSATSNIPGCNYGTPDAVGSGALRLTPASNFQRGALVSNYTFPSNQGLQVTFTSYTYGGDSGGTAGLGADGMSFYLMDGAVGTLVGGVPNTGATGGSLGYSCSNTNALSDGVTGAYLGLGIDEYGNFLNSGDNTSTGIANQSSAASANGYNGWGSGTYQPNRIGLRGAGNVSWYWLNLNFPAYYPNSLSVAQRQQAVRDTCRTGNVWNYALSTPAQVSPAVPVTNYKAIPGGYWVLPSAQPIAKESTSVRTSATPITYKLRITPGGSLSFLYSYNGGAYQPVLTNWNITAANGPLPATFRFGFSSATGGSNNVHDLTCFVAEPTVSNSSAGANTVQAGQVRTSTQVYLATYDPNNWTGTLQSLPLVKNAAGTTLSVAATAEWDANCGLTGGACPTMGTDSAGVALNSIAVLPPASRTLLTWNGSNGIPLQWASLAAAQQTVLNTNVGGTNDGKGSDRLDWLRGDRTKEQTATPAPGPLRARAGVLGDIVDSSPTWVGPPSQRYSAAFKDALYNTTGTETSYTTFKANLATRQNVVYAGSNDGFVHGFRTGSYAADGVTFINSTDDGKEIIGFQPATVLGGSNIVSLTDPAYGHYYFANTAPGFGDLHYGGKWHTWLVSGMGPGGKEIFSLDITDPTSVASGAGPAFAESNASGLVKGSWTPTTLTAAGCTNAAVNCGHNLGFTYGTPLVRRMHNGKWAIIFGNGFGSVFGRAGIFVGLVDSSAGSTGAVSFVWLDTGSGSAASPNGIAYVSSADLDGDYVTDYLYAGDQKGNVWRFDVTSSNTADWKASTYGNAAATPLFIAKDSAGATQPITTRIAVTATLTGGSQRVLLGFGTGQQNPFTTATATTYASGTQSAYGIWDWDMNAWNSGITTAGGVAIPAASQQYAAMTAPQAGLVRANLLVNTLASATATNRTLAVSKVCWKSSSTCGAAVASNTQLGWLFDFPVASEQLIYNPIFTGGALFLNSVIQPQNSAGQCTLALPTGWSMAFDMASGGGQLLNIFPDSTGSFARAAGAQSIVGIKQNSVGTPYIVSVDRQQYAINQTVGGSPTTNKINPQGGITVKRTSWEQLR